MRLNRHVSVRAITYWTSTSLVALAFLSGGLASAAGSAQQVQGMTALGYPAYFVTMLGIWKCLGAITLVAPRFPRLKEWAYAGIAFDLIGAAASHFAVGHSMGKIAVPLVLLAITAMSWSLRPSGRRLQLPPRATPSSFALV